LAKEIEGVAIEMIPFPNKKYKIIYADPPWCYKDKSKSHGGGAESHYQCMDLKEICNLPINQITEDNSVLFLWVTMPMLIEGLEVIKSWGFRYKTCGFTWVKLNKNKSIYMGMGRYTRANAEICLLATKGKGLKRINCGIKSVQLHERLEHSHKPNLFRNLIVNLFGDLPKIELFARQEVNGWDSWGDEI
jgi:N6-adenosine-specific RNA methylase IME4